MAVSENDLIVGPLVLASGVTVISLDFYFELEEWLDVYKSGSETPLVLGVDYTTSGEGTSSGSVTLTTPANGTDSYSVYLTVPLERSSDMQLRGEFKSGPFNLELDRVWQAMQGLKTTVSRSLSIKRSSTAQAPTVPNPETGKGLIWGTDGNLMNASIDPGDIAVDVAAAQAARDEAVNATLNAFSKGAFQDDDDLSKIDATLISSWTIDGATGFENKVGANNTKPVTGSFANDTGYVAGQASYSAIMGGYDNIANGLASIMATQHGFIKSGADHATILGGSVHGIEAGSYGGVFSGTNNLISSLRYDGVTAAVPSFSLIAGGSGNRVHNSHGLIVGGLNNVVDGEFSCVFGATASKALGNFDTVLGSNSETRKGSGGSGQRNTIGGGRFNIIDSVTNPTSNTISGGEDNEIYGSFNTIGGGDNGTIGTPTDNSAYASILGGLNNIITSGNGGTVGGGRDNEATVDYATVVGGRGNKATALYATAMGYQSEARHQSGVSMADGAFSTAGDAQTSKVIRRVETTDATLTAMGTVPIPNDTTVAFSILVVARRTDVDGEGAGYKIEGVIDRNGSAATTSLIGTVTVTTIAEDVAGWGVTAVANASSGGISIQVTGEASKTIRWVAAGDLVEVTG